MKKKQKLLDIIIKYPAKKNVDLIAHFENEFKGQNFKVVIQPPLDQGIIHQFKNKYRKPIVKFMLLAGVINFRFSLREKKQMSIQH